MSLNLEIFPVWDEEEYLRTNVIKTPDCLKFDSNEALFAQFIALDDAHRFPASTIETHELNGFEIETYSDRGLVRKRHDKLGAIRFGYARELKKLRMDVRTSRRNHAIMVYINSLPDGLMIVLYWH